MRAFNKRKMSKDIYLFKYKNKKISLTMTINYLDEYGNESGEKRFYHGMFKLIRNNNKMSLNGDIYKSRDFFKQLSKIVDNSNGSSITRVMNYFKNNESFEIDFSKVTRKDFVSRDIWGIRKILEEKGAMICTY